MVEEQNITNDDMVDAKVVITAPKENIQNHHQWKNHDRNNVQTNAIVA